MKKIKFALLSSLVLTLSACAPAVLGSQTLNPVVAESNLVPIKAAAGQTVYVQYTYPRGVFTLQDERFSSLLIGLSSRNANGTVQSKESRAFWLNMTATGLPADWQISLADAAVRKDVVATYPNGDMVSLRYYERVRVVYKVTLPAGATGSGLAMLNFKDGNTDIGAVPLMINVGDASGLSVGA